MRYTQLRSEMAQRQHVLSTIWKSSRIFAVLKGSEKYVASQKEAAAVACLQGHIVVWHSLCLRLYLSIQRNWLFTPFYHSAMFLWHISHHSMKLRIITPLNSSAVSRSIICGVKDGPWHWKKIVWHPPVSHFQKHERSMEDCLMDIPWLGHGTGWRHPTNLRYGFTRARRATKG